MAINEQVNILIKAKDEASKTLKGMESQFGSLKTAIIGIGAAYLTWNVGIGFIKSVISAAAEEEKQWIKVATAIKLRGQSVAATLPQVQAMTDALEMQLGVADELIAEGFQRLIIANYSTARSYETVKLAIDITAITGDNLVTTIEALIKGAAGSEMQLSRLAASLGINIEKAATAADKIKLINDQVSGAAESQMTGYHKAITQLGIAWERFMETLGKPILEDAVKVLALFVRTVTELYYILDKLFKLTTQPWKLFYKETWVGVTDGVKAAREATDWLKASFKEAADEGERLLKLNRSGRKGDFKDSMKPLVEKFSLPSAAPVDDPIIVSLRAIYAEADKVAVKLNDVRVASEFLVRVGETEERPFSLPSEAPDAGYKLPGLLRQIDVDNNKELQRQVEEDWNNLQQRINEIASQVGGAISSALTPALVSVITRAKSVEDAFRGVGQSIRDSLLGLAINALVQFISKQIVSLFLTKGEATAHASNTIAIAAETTATWGLVAAKIALNAASGGVAGAVELGQQAINWIFDDKVNDNALEREVRWVGHLIARNLAGGIASGTMQIGQQRSSQPALAMAGAQNITIQFLGPVTSADFVRNEVIPQIERAVNYKQTRLATNKKSTMTGVRDGYGA